MTLWQKSIKKQYRLQKFLCMVDRHDKTDFWIEIFFGSGLFLTLFFNLMDQKNAPSKKSC